MVNKSKKTQALFYFAASLTIVILLNIINSAHFFRLDLTEEKRFSVSDASKEIMRNLDDVVLVEVYLTGDLPAGFKRLERSIKETLNELKVYGGKKIQFRFIDPSAEPNFELKTQAHNRLMQKGLQPTNLFINEDGKKVEKRIFPGAIISYRQRETPIILLKGNSTGSPDEVLNQSIENTEFELVNAIQAITAESKKKIAFLTGNGEADSLRSADLALELGALYKFKRVNIREIANLDGFDAIIVAKPMTKFSDDQKLKIDQFVVSGGRAIFFVDPVNLSADSMGSGGSVAVPLDVHIDDLFFQWGIRMNKDLIQDINCGYLPMAVGMMGDKPQIEMVNWRYFPVINSYVKHPIVRNLDGIYARFVSSIDTIKAAGIRKTPLMFTSPYSRIVATPADVNFNEMRQEPRREDFNKSTLPIAYLLEGKFNSAYAGRPLIDAQFPGLLKEGKESRIIICSDGDLVLNDFDYKKNEIVPIGFDKYTQKKFANRDFLMNSIAYLLDDKGLINVRSKQITLRPLDKIKVKEEKGFYQIVNIIIPILLVITFAFSWAVYRKRKYTRI